MILECLLCILNISKLPPQGNITAAQLRSAQRENVANPDGMPRAQKSDTSCQRELAAEEERCGRSVRAFCQQQQTASIICAGGSPNSL